MLLRFNVSNFMSFDNEQEFAMYPGRVEKYKERIVQIGDCKVLKFAAIYGANASGKSNLIKAIEAGKNIITRGLNSEKYKTYYFRNNPRNKNIMSKFEYEISISDRKYAYGFEVMLNDGVVLQEWLYELKEQSEIVVFERVVEEKKYYYDEQFFSEKKNSEDFEFYLKDANNMKSCLLLHELARRNLDESDFKCFNEIYTWFDKKLVIIYPDTILGEGYWKFNKNDENLIKILQYFDTGIVNYEIRKIQLDAFREYFPDEELFEKVLETPLKRENAKVLKRGILSMRKNLFEICVDSDGKKEIYKLSFVHGKYNQEFEYGEESDGTKRLIELLEVILGDGKDKTFIIDELDRSLHPKMTKKYVETFFRFAKENKSQLIITTHESNLMDLNILRRDEVWFTERDDEGRTEVYSLEKFKTRYDTVVSKAYLNGRYGAVPVFRDFNYYWGDDK